jgi:hypothetical protein
MTLRDSQGKLVTDYDIEVDGPSYDDPVMLVYAEYEDGGEVADSELKYMEEEYADVLFEKAQEYLQGRAESYYEGDR